MKMRGVMDCREAILSDNVYDYIADFPIANLTNLEPVICHQEVDDLYNVVYLNRTGIPNMEVNFFEYHSVPKLYGLMQLSEDTRNASIPLQEANTFDPGNLIASGITQVQRSPLNLTGRGVVIGIIDTGIDYTNPVFLDESGRSRILAIWDQTIQTGTMPKGFLYGSEYTREDINRALTEENPYDIVPTRDVNGHGSALAGVAAGSNVRTGRPYIGAAPNADIVVVKLKECKRYLRDFYLVADNVPAYQENDIMLAVKYINSFVILEERPVVICLGLGTNMGDHAGSMPLSQYLSKIGTLRSRSVVICGGNEGNASHHYLGDFLQNARTEIGTLTGGSSRLGISQDVEIQVAEGSQGFFLEFWGSLPDALWISVISPGGEIIPPVRLGVRQSITYGFVYERSRITIDSLLVEPSSGEELILFRLYEPTPGIWTFRIEAASELYNGVYHMWLPITQFLNVSAEFLTPSPYVTLTEPAMARNVISVSTYNAENDSFYINSGRGYSRIGEIRPDFAAPGVNISTISGARTGSSFAAAITAGAVAQFMQWAVVEGNNELADSREVKSYFIRGAVRSTETTYPNREWGYGRLNIEQVFEALRGV